MQMFDFFAADLPKNVQQTIMIVQLVTLVISVFFIVVQWKIFTKAGKPGWACLVPIYNFIVLLEIVEKPAWWIVLAIIPFVNLYVLIVVLARLAKAFGKDTGFAVGLVCLAPVFMPILAFGSAEYVGGLED